MKKAKYLMIRYIDSSIVGVVLKFLLLLFAILVVTSVFLMRHSILFPISDYVIHCDNCGTDHNTFVIYCTNCGDDIGNNDVVMSKKKLCRYHKATSRDYNGGYCPNCGNETEIIEFQFNELNSADIFFMVIGMEWNSRNH